MVQIWNVEFHRSRSRSTQHTRVFFNTALRTHLEVPYYYDCITLQLRTVQRCNESPACQEICQETFFILLNFSEMCQTTESWKSLRGVTRVILVSALPTPPPPVQAFVLPSEVHCGVFWTSAKLFRSQNLASLG